MSLFVGPFWRLLPFWCFWFALFPKVLYGSSNPANMIKRWHRQRSCGDSNLNLQMKRKIRYLLLFRSYNDRSTIIVSIIIQLTQVFWLTFLAVRNTAYPQFISNTSRIQKSSSVQAYDYIDYSLDITAGKYTSFDNTIWITTYIYILLWCFLHVIIPLVLWQLCSHFLCCWRIQWYWYPSRPQSFAWRTCFRTR